MRPTTLIAGRGAFAARPVAVGVQIFQKTGPYSNVPATSYRVAVGKQCAAATTSQVGTGLGGLLWAPALEQPSASEYELGHSKWCYIIWIRVNVYVSVQMNVDEFVLKCYI